MKGMFCLLAVMVSGIGAMGQVKNGSGAQWLLEKVGEELVEMGYEVEIESVYGHFGELVRRPLDINRASAEQLEDMIILTDYQIASLLEYRNRSGYILSAAELQLINGFSSASVELLRPFIIFGKEDGDGYFAGRRGDGKEGFRERSEGDVLLKTWWKKNDGENVGPDFYSQVKCRYLYNEYLQLGFTLEKDSGERFMCGGIPSGDFSSFHLALKGVRAGKHFQIRRAVLGDYTVRLGQGLVIWRGFNFSGNSVAQGAYKRGERIVPYTSSDENNFNRGTAATLRKELGKGKSIDVAMFFSLKNVDARINGNKYTSLPEDGLHNTASTLETRKTLGEMIYGGNILYNGTKVRLGLNWVGYGYDALNGRRVLDYNRYQIYQGQYGNFSAEATLLWGSRRVFMELAADYGGNMAFIGGMVWRKGEWNLSSTLRSYSRGYIAPYAGAYSTISSCSNQTGVSFVADRYLKYGLRLVSGVDYTYHPWKRYNIGEASHTAKVWFRMEDASGSSPWSVKLYGNWTSFRQQYKLGVKGAFGAEPLSWMKLKVRWEVASTRFSTFGAAAGPEAVFSDSAGKLKLVLRCAWYNSRDWNNRIYMYEYDLPSSFSSSLLYGKGVKCYMLLNYKVGRRVSASFKADDQLKLKLGLKMRFF